MRWSVVFITAIFSCYIGFINGFPLVYSDTGSYIFSGFTNTVLVDRPITYGLFLRHLSLNESLWINVILQGLMLAHLVYLVFKYFSGKTQFTGQYLFFYFSVLLFTGISVNVSQLMPDVFTPVVILCLILLLLAPEMSKIDAVTTGVLLVISIMMHNSHFAIMGLFIISVSLLKVIAWWRKKAFFISLKKGILILSLTVFSWLSLCSIHYSMGGGFTTSRGASIFLVNRLLEIGVLEPYLKDECPNRDWKICGYQEKFPPDFLWDEANSPLYKTGGWEKNTKEYGEIWKGALSKPHYVKKFLLRSVEASLVQFFMFKVEHPPVLREGSPVYGPIHWFWRPVLRQYLASNQANNRLNFDLLNFVQTLFIFSMLGLTVYLLATKKLNQRVFRFTVLVVVMVCINAIVMATLGGAFDRFQARVVWLLALPVFMYFTEKDLLGTIKRKLIK